MFCSAKFSHFVFAETTVVFREKCCPQHCVFYGLIFQLLTQPTLTALIRPVPVSIVLNLVSPILMARICAPGATPFRSGSLGKCPAAILATWVPCAPEDKK